MADANPNTLSANQLTEAVKQILNSRGFDNANPHLTSAEINRLRRDLEWPSLKPVFSPYAVTHNGYSQGEFIHSQAFISS